MRRTTENLEKFMRTSKTAPEMIRYDSHVVCIACALSLSTCATAAAAAAGGGAGVECASIHRVHHSSTSSVNCADDVIRYSR